MTNQRFTITFRSDWHVGTGSGRHGHLDRVYDRDADGHPYVGAKALAGLLRTQVLQIASGLDAGPSGVWHDWAEWLLGSEPALATGAVGQAPRPGVVTIDSAHLSTAVKQRLAAAPSLTRHMAVERPSVRLDEYGTAMDDHLRFVELAPAGLVLSGSVSLPDDAPDEARALLHAGFSSIRAVGAGRRRGQGRCTVVLDNPPSRSLADLHSPQPPPAQAPTLGNTGAGVAPGDGADDAWAEIQLTITALSPVLVMREARGNVVSSHSTIPGNVVLAMVASLAPQAAAAAIASDALRVGDALPLAEESVALPAPLSLHRPKVVHADAVDRHVNLAVYQPESTEQLKQVRQRFVTADWVSAAGSATPAGGTPSATFANTATVTRTHNVIDDALQRPTAALGGLYTYQAIAPGSVFGATVRVRTSALDAMVIESGAGVATLMLDGERRIGASRKDDYGRVSVTSVSMVDAAGAAAASDTATIWLTSDALVVDDRLRPTPTLPQFIATLSDHSGVELEQVGRGFTRPNRRESWQSSWSLPRPTLCTLQAGTVVTVRRTDGGTLDVAALASAGHHGIGQRCAEGYGRFVVNHPLTTAAAVNISPAAVQRSGAPTAFLPLEGQDAELMSELQQVAWEALIHERVTSAISTGVQKDTFEIGSKPGNSQLGALRTAIRHGDGTLTPVGKWWSGVQDVDKRKAKWPRKTAELLTTLLSEGRAAEVWAILGVTEADAREITPDDASGALSAQAPKAVLALLGAVARAGQHDAAGTSGPTSDEAEGGAA